VKAADGATGGGGGGGTVIELRFRWTGGGRGGGGGAAPTGIGGTGKKPSSLIVISQYRLVPVLSTIACFDFVDRLPFLGQSHDDTASISCCGNAGILLT